MLINQGVAISTTRVLLVPYEAHHVPIYHDWMKDANIQETTASEPLLLTEEYEMQKSWRSDNDKLTFIACLPLEDLSQDAIEHGLVDAPDRMLGDVNLYLTPAEEDNEGCVGELELMIAPTNHRRQGYGRTTILAFMHYIQQHLDDIMAEYRGIGRDGRMDLLQLIVKIGSKNEKSIRLFESIGFLKVREGSNYFGEVELSFEGFLGKSRTGELLQNWDIQEYKELMYTSK